MLPQGNQDIFFDLTSLYLTYKTIGVEGIQALSEHRAMRSIEDLTDFFIKHAALEENYKSYVDNDSTIDIKKLSIFFNKDDNADVSLKIALAFMQYEQSIIQDMYDPMLTKALTNEFLKKCGDFLKITGVYVDGEFYSFGDYVKDPMDYNQRVEYLK